MKTKALPLRVAVTLLLALCTATAAWAEQITADQARQQALNFLNSQQASGGQRRAPAQLNPVSQVSGLYVFNVANDGGFVIVSNDDVTIPVLGYSDTGSIDPDNIPDNMRAWLQGYANEIAWAREHITPATKGARASSPAKAKNGTHETTEIPKMLTTKWNQKEPYYNQCPYIGVYCVTGCVATAMAQVMNYHKWPTSETAVIPDYVWKNWTSYMNNGKNYGVGELEATTFDWNNMLDSYTGSATDAQKDAVAWLMRYCGQSVEMNYWVDASEAQTPRVASALKTYFNYSEKTQYVSRSFYSYANWTDIIYHELKNGRPVLYGGQSIDNGHAFVCDGYKYEQETDLFHINWGWGGTSDGFFVLSVLNPNVQGVGGSATNAAYNFGQEAIIGIQKKKNDDTEGNVSDLVSSAKITINLSIASITPSPSTIALGESVSVTLRVTNNSDNAYDGELCLVVNGVIGAGKMFEIAAKATEDCVIDFTPTKAGAYTLSPAFPNGVGGYQGPNNVTANLTVVDQTPTSLTATSIDSRTATIGWTNVGEANKWNLRYRQVTLEDFNGTFTPWNTYEWSTTGGWEFSSNGGIDDTPCYKSPSFDNDTDLDPDVGLFTPEFALGGSISFYAWGEDEYFVMYYTTDGGRHVFSFSNFITTTSTPTKYTFDLSEFAGQTGQIMINHCNSSGHTSNSSLYVDNVVYSEPTDAWKYTSNVTSPYTLNRLAANTSYEAQVQADINGGGKWSDGVVFTTLTAPTDLVATVATANNILGAQVSWTACANETAWNLRYRVRDASSTAYDFNGDFTYPDLTNGWQATSWQIYDGDGDNNNWTVSASADRDDSKCFTVNSVSGESSNCLYTPQFTLGGSISFYVKGAGEQLYVYLVDDHGKYIDIVNYGIETTSDWVQHTINLSAYEGAGRVVFVHDTEGVHSTLCLDDVTIYKPGDWTTVPNVTNPANIAPLAVSTTYGVQVQAVFSDGTSGWSETATFTTTSLELANDDRQAETKNTDLIAAWNGVNASVTLKDRTLLGKEQWNTMCLPYDVDAGLLTILIGALTQSNPTVTAKVLDTSEMGTSLSDAGLLTLKFKVPANGKILAGTPFIIKSTSQTASVDLSAYSLPVTIDGSAEALARMTQPSNDGKVKFVGQWSTFDITNENIDEIIYVASDNNIGYSKNPRNLKCFRAHFWVKPSETGTKTVRAIKLDFGDGEETGIINLSEFTDYSEYSDYSDYSDKNWYTLDGRKLDAEPTTKGLYIVNGRKVVIK